ncbi:ketopantoate reductase family protein [Sphingobium sp. YG1]|uniref:ketopantoate reductase family protein n=1 Tax=Sphingobium sp. YG1 TaxID=2082188 RepID=UPI000DBAF0AD|nr:2-dehydropantoate 2-reductase [Sphingobium sp. YG1]BBD01512.1 2-dehydropantoate 2-reductase [Sphingobium sp. YG1]
MNIAIIGAGAMGCLFAARLAEGGQRVDLIDIDDRRISAIRSHGIDLSDDEGRRSIPVEVRQPSDASGVRDLVILFTKAAHSAAAIAAASHLVGPDTLGLTLQNGLGNADAMLSVFPGKRVLLGVTDYPSDLSDDTQIRSHGEGSIIIGPLERESLDHAETCAKAFQASGMNAYVEHDIFVPIWEKVGFNAALNAICTVAGMTVDQLNNETGHALIAAVIDEAVGVAKSAGVEIDHARISGKIVKATIQHKGHMPSMLQDRLNGRQTEIESINGAIVRQADEAGIAVPVNRTLTDLVRLIDRGR